MAHNLFFFSRFFIVSTLTCLVTLPSPTQAEPGPGPKLTRRYEVHIFNKLPQSLTTHCQSRDDDFKNHTLAPNDTQHWSFYTNIFRTTRYYCRFWWGPRTQSFDVFYTGWAGKFEMGMGMACSWVVKPDGFYFHPDIVYYGTWTKNYTWN